jgi:SAM-dependent methyltransferase
MHWKTKAKIQNAISILPSSASYAVYYWLQRRSGGLRYFNPVSRLKAGIETWKLIKKQDCEPSGKVFLEVGTGRVALLPLAYWLMGAEKTISIDLNPYLKEELMKESLRYIFTNEEEISSLFGLLLDRERFNQLLELSRNSEATMNEFITLCRLEYISPGDASDTHLPDRSIDFHTSYTVFEHIPKDVLKKILEEGNRIIRNNGLFIHFIDYSDHFSHSDNTISAINFLQYSDDEWGKYAGNRYMYMNRMRHDDFIDLFTIVEHRIMEANTNIDESCAKLLKNENLNLNEKFSSKPEDILAITSAWTITQKIG